MVQGMAFLSKKGFNPQNQVNRKSVWEAQQAKKLEQERIAKRQAELEKEREEEEWLKSRGQTAPSLRFMYDAPPGMNKGDKQQNGEEEEEEGKARTSKATNENKSATNNTFDTTNKSTEAKDVTQVQPGDDAAAIAFRRMLAEAKTSHTLQQQVHDDDNDDDNYDSSKPKLGFAPVLQGSTLDVSMNASSSKKDNDNTNTDARSALEKAVGVRDRGGALTLEEQVARFPQLANAPMAKGMSSTDVGVSFKPLGAQLRNVRCLACGTWGHSRGDRECSKTGWDPFEAITKLKPSSTTAAATNTAAAAAAVSTIQPNPLEKAAKKDERKRKHSDVSVSSHDDDDDSYSSSSSSSTSSSDDSRRKRHKKRKHKQHKKKRKHYHHHHHDKEQKKRYKRRSESPTHHHRRKRHKKSHRKRSSDK